MKASGWTPDRRARQAEVIWQWKPWEHSTGPRTPEGKAQSQRNGSQPGSRALLREIAKVLREHRKVLGDLVGL